MSKVTFTIKATMEKRWANHFWAFLKRMEYNGKIGHSSTLAFYADGDGDFCPEFETDFEWEARLPRKEKQVIAVEALYDAG